MIHKSMRMRCLLKQKSYSTRNRNCRSNSNPLSDTGPMPLDGFPILGYTKTVPNLYIALMHSGVTLAPLVGEMATLEILDGTRVDWFNPYRLERLQ